MATSAVRPERLDTEAPMALRSWERLVIQSLSWTTSCASWVCRSSTVLSIAERLSITCPMSSSRSASALVSEAVLLIRLPMVPPSPWSTLTRFIESWLTSLGVSAWNRGWNPLNSSVRFRAGVVRETGMVPPCREPLAAGRALLERHVAVTDQVEEPDRGLGRRGDGHVLLDLEGDLGAVAVLDLHVLDRADGDAGDPDVVTLLDQAGRAEVGLVGLSRCRRRTSP